MPEIPEPRAPWWREADEAVLLLTSVVNAVVGEAGRVGTYTPPPGSPPPRRRRSPASLRHIAEVIRAYRLAPGMSVDKDTVARVLAGDPEILTDPIAVIAVIHACHRIAGRRFQVADAARVAAASARIGVLIEAARAADLRAPSLLPAVPPPSGIAVREQATDSAPPSDPLSPLDSLVPLSRPTVGDGRAGRRSRIRFPDRYSRVLRRVATAVVVPIVASATGAVVALQATREEASAADLPCADGTTGDDLVRPEVIGPDDRAQMIEPVLDFDEMNGSARYNRYRGRTYYWGRAGSDDNVPRAGGARIRWQTVGGPWRNCPVSLAVEERDYVRTWAVATTIGGRAARVQVCLWRQEPFRENCTPVLS